MTNTGSLSGLIVGGGMAAAPAMVDMPFYESQFWLGTIAVTGFIVLLGTGVKIGLDIRKNLKWDGEDRRDKN